MRQTYVELSDNKKIDIYFVITSLEYTMKISIV